MANTTWSNIEIKKYPKLNKNIKTIMFTGDTELITDDVCKKLQIRENYCRLLPTQKYNKLQEILKNKKLAKDDLLVMAAAISDYIPSKKAKGKIKKSGANLNLELKENIDILSSLKELKCKKIGFKMEMDEQSALSSAKNMLENKALDAVCLNVLKAQNYFGSEQNEVLFITKNSQKMLKMASKHEIAAQIAELSENLSEDL